MEAIKEFLDVELSTVDAAQKIKVIKLLRDIFSLGLKEAKDYVDKAPSMLKKNIRREDAEKFKKNLEAGGGCTISLK